MAAGTKSGSSKQCWPSDHIIASTYDHVCVLVNYQRLHHSQDNIHKLFKHETNETNSSRVLADTSANITNNTLTQSVNTRANRQHKRAMRPVSAYEPNDHVCFQFLLK